MKLNYRHSLKSMRKAMENFNETFLHTMEAGKDCFQLKELNNESGDLTQSCGVFYSCKEMAEYINKRNAV